MISAHTRLLGLIGDPVGQSVSPAMHNAALQALGLDCVYLAFRVTAPSLIQAVGGLRALDAGGFNVTIPHKVKILPLLDELAPEAAAIGAVNTIVNRDGRLVGYNTDAGGFRAALRKYDVDPAGMTAVLIGAGGAARAIAFALVSQKASLTILARRPEAALDLVLRLKAGAGQVEARELTRANLEAALGRGDLVINATSVGMTPDSDRTPVPGDLLRAGMTVFDAVYHPQQTRLLREAETAGAAVIGGLEMLVAQAALSFELWTGQKAPLEIMARAGQEALER